MSTQQPSPQPPQSSQQNPQPPQSSQPSRSTQPSQGHASSPQGGSSSESPQTSPDQQSPQGPVGFGWGLLLVILVIGSGTLMGANMPWSLFSVLFSGGALLLAILMLRSALRPGVPGMAKAMGILLIAVTGFGVMMSLMSVALMPLTAPYRECRSTSVTQSGLHECDVQYRQTLERISGLSTR